MDKKMKKLKTNRQVQKKIAETKSNLSNDFPNYDKSQATVNTRKRKRNGQQIEKIEPAETRLSLTIYDSLIFSSIDNQITKY